MAFLSGAGRLVAMVDPLDSVSEIIRRARSACVLDDPHRCVELARALIAAKVSNQRILLQRNAEGLSDQVLEDMAAERRSQREWRVRWMRCAGTKGRARRSISGISRGC